ncbi:MAG TPA: tetratricopeptide repeat protein [Pyrinomonadaceae bacterium]|jgi:tetratricopeptide (TPR) repeat protein
MSKDTRPLLISFISLTLFAHLTLTDSVAAAPRPLSAILVQGKSTIMGIVFDSSGRPLEKVRVELLDDVYTVLQTVRTTGTGQFIFRALSAGVFNIRVISESGDYAEQMQRVELISLNRGKDIGPSGDFRQVDFFLRPKNERRTTTAAGVVFSQNVPEDAKKSYSKAVSELDKKRIEQGITGLKSALEIFPDYYLALERLGEEYAKRSEFEEARKALERAVKVNPKGAEGFYWLGIAEFNLKRYAESVESFRQSAQLNPASVNSIMWTGIALRYSGKLEEAETQLKLAGKRAAQPIPQAHWELALLYNQTRRYAAAANELELFLKAQPDSRDAEGIRKLIKQLREKEKEKPKS